MANGPWHMAPQKREVRRMMTQHGAVGMIWALWVGAILPRPVDTLSRGHARVPGISRIHLTYLGWLEVRCTMWDVAQGISQGMG